MDRLFLRIHQSSMILAQFRFLWFAFLCVPVDWIYRLVIVQVFSVPTFVVTSMMTFVSITSVPFLVVFPPSLLPVMSVLVVSVMIAMSVMRMSPFFLAVSRLVLLVAHSLVLAQALTTLNSDPPSSARALP